MWSSVLLKLLSLEKVWMQGTKKKKNVIKKTILSSHWPTDTSSDIVVIFTCASVYCSLFKASNNYKPIYIYINIYIIYKYTFSEPV